MRVRLEPVQSPICRFPALGILQNDAASIAIDNSPLFDLVQRSKTAQTGQVVVEAAISNARRLSGAVDITHAGRTPIARFRI